MILTSNTEATFYFRYYIDAIDVDARQTRAAQSEYAKHSLFLSIKNNCLTGSPSPSPSPSPNPLALALIP